MLSGVFDILGGFTLEGGPQHVHEAKALNMCFFLQARCVEELAALRLLDWLCGVGLSTSEEDSVNKGGSRSRRRKSDIRRQRAVQLQQLFL